MAIMHFHILILSTNESKKLYQRQQYFKLQGDILNNSRSIIFLEFPDSLNAKSIIIFPSKNRSPGLIKCKVICCRVNIFSIFNVFDSVTIRAAVDFPISLLRPVAGIRLWCCCQIHPGKYSSTFRSPLQVISSGIQVL